MKNSNHASKALAVVLSGALAFAPAANAALDESNMAYTAASEGFYGSLRVQYANRESDGEDNDSNVEADDSRLGVGGSADLGSGLEAFYGFEWNLGDAANNGGGLKTRQHHVGLRGDWGSIWLGAFDSVIVRFGGFATTDILDQFSGNFEPIYRTSNAIAYVSPDLNGFNFGIEVQADDGEKKTTTETDPIIVDGLNDNATTGTLSIQLPTTADAVETVVDDDGNDIDSIGLGAGYSIQNLTFSGAYRQVQDYQGSDDDLDQYALGIGYSQDNWIVAAMYGEESFGDIYDDPFFSFAAGVSIDKLDFHGLWEQKTREITGSPDVDTTIAAITARYHLGSKARLRAGWRNTEKGDVDSTDYALGLRVDF